jgi:hypothetical protein
MRAIAIVGGGQAGLFLGIGLADAGYRVTLFSDRSPDDHRYRSRPTGNAIIQSGTIALEEKLGLCYWRHEAPEVRRVDFTLNPNAEKRLLHVKGGFDEFGQGYDLRMKNARWMEEFVARGGTLAIEAVDLDRLEKIAAEHELTLVAGGKGTLLKNVFARDDTRSEWTEPPRRLLMTMFRSRYGVDDKIHFVFNPPHGEWFATVLHHMSGVQCQTALWEAVPGGPMDVYADCMNDGAEAFRRAIAYVEKHNPDYAHLFEGAELMDANSWTAGFFTPTVQKPVGRLPSGRIVMPLGDTAISFDPIGGFGANNAERMAWLILERIKARGDSPFDAAWMTEVFDHHWDHFADYACRFNNMLLKPATPDVLELLDAAQRSEELATYIFSGINRPALLRRWVDNPAGAKRLIAEATAARARAKG